MMLREFWRFVFFRNPDPLARWLAVCSWLAAFWLVVVIGAVTRANL